MEIEFLGRFILVFSTIFVLVDPIGVVPSFIALTKNYSEKEMKNSIIRACLAGALILIFFSLAGAQIFKILSIDMNAFRAGGGLLLLITALEMLRAKSNCKSSTIETVHPQDREDISIVPLAIPLLLGPGAITSVTVFSMDHEQEHLIQFLIILGAIIVTFLISYLVLKSSNWIKHWLGDSGVSVIQRIMGLLLVSLSLQFIAEGGKGLLGL